MNETRKDQDASTAREERRAAHLRNLRRIQQDACNGARLEGHDRLYAAAALGRLWREAKRHKMRQEALIDAMERVRSNFRLDRWTIKELPASRSAMDESYRNKKLPLRDLNTYLEAISFLCVQLGLDPDRELIAMLRETSRWRVRNGPAEPGDPSAENVVAMLESLTREFLDTSDWAATHARLKRLPFAIDPYSQSLAFQRESRMLAELSGLPDIDCWYAEEVFPHPAVPLVRHLRATHPVELGLEPLGTPLSAFLTRFDSALAAVPPKGEVELRSMHLQVWHECSLVVAPMELGGFRPFLRFALRHAVGFEPYGEATWVERSAGLGDLLQGRGLVEVEGSACRLHLPEQELGRLKQPAVDDPDRFEDPDNLENDPSNPGNSDFGPYKWSHLPLDARLVRYWLGGPPEGYTRVESLDDADLGSRLAKPDVLGPDVPVEECNFPVSRAGAAIERAVHDGRLLASLLASARRWASQADLIEHEWREAAEAHTSLFLARDG